MVVPETSEPLASQLWLSLPERNRQMALGLLGRMIREGVVDKIPDAEAGVS